MTQDETKRFNAVVNRIADNLDIAYGALLAAVDPVTFLEMVADTLEKLRGVTGEGGR